ncbi:MAG: hypothetical protein WC708_13880 [Lentisphaeria bacterium]
MTVLATTICRRAVRAAFGLLLLPPFLLAAAPPPVPASHILEVANFRPKPNLEYTPLAKVRAGGGLLRIVGGDENGGVEIAPAPAGASAPRTVRFEVSGTFDEGGCPDWAQIRAVTITLTADRPVTAALRFFRAEGAAPLAAATFTTGAGGRAVRLPREQFTGSGLAGEVTLCELELPAASRLRLQSLGVELPEPLYQAEMARRLERRDRHYQWRREVLQARGLAPFQALDGALAAFRRRLAARQYDAAARAGGAVDRAYWLGVEFCGLRAMNAANGDRAAALRDPALVRAAETGRGRVDALAAQLRSSPVPPSLAAAAEEERRLAGRTMEQMRAKNLRPTVRGRKFYSPSGAPVNFFGAHAFALSRRGLLARPEAGFDNLCKRLVAMGFNGIRFEAEEYRLLPAEDRIDAAVAADYREAIDTAWRYGLWVQYDNHFYLPGWVCQGPKEYPNPVPASQTNSYQNLAGTLRVWDATAQVVAGQMNILTFETPSNEPFFYDPAGKSIRELPALMAAWNAFLRDRYRTREALNAAWTRNVEFPRENTLRPDEDWARNSIQPPGFSENRLADMKNESARIWDWLMFARVLQERTTGAIAATVHRRLPAATFMQQFMIGNEWDHSPIPLNYQALLQVRADPAIFIGSHYGMGGLQVRKAVALGTPSIDSENQAEENYAACIRQKLLDSGVCLFADFARWGGGMLWENDDADFKMTTAYVPLMADFFVNAEPLQSSSPAVAVVEPTRLSATMQNDSVAEILAVLDQAGVPCHVLEEQYLLAHPEALAAYRCAVVNLTRADPQLLDVLAGRPDLQLFCFGSPWRDAWCRGWPEGIPGWLAGHRRLIRTWAADSATATAAGSALSLEGSVRFRYDERKSAAAEGWQNPDFDDRAWERKPVPGRWGELGIMGSGNYFLGEGWYRFQVTVPDAWRGKTVTLVMGAVDDTDAAWLNGVPVGATTTATPNWWNAPRRYRLPVAAIRFGGDNVLAVKVTNTLGDAGIWRAPVALVTEDAARARVTRPFGFLKPGDALEIAVVPEAFQPPLELLAPAAESLAVHGGRAVLIRDGNWLFWGGAPRFTNQPPPARVLLSWLKQAGLDVAWPPAAAARIIPFTGNYFVVQGAPEADTPIALPGCRYQAVGLEVLRDVSIRDGRVRATVPKGALAVVRVWPAPTNSNCNPQP